MRLRSKLIGISIIIIFVLLTFMTITSYYFIDKKFSGLEDESVEINLERAAEGFARDSEVLETVVFDWALWDDTHEFVSGEYDDFPESNLEESTLLNIGADFFLITDLEGEIFHLTVIEELDENQLRILNERIVGEKELFSTGEITGIVHTSDEPIMMSSQLIFKSDGSGPSAGALTMGYFLDEETAEGIGELVRLPVETFRYEEIKNNEILTKLEDNESYVNKSKNYLEAYAQILDISGNPELIIKITMERDVYKNGIDSLVFFMIITWISGCLTAVFLAILNIIVSKRVSSPMEKLSKMADEIGKGNLDQKIEPKYENEINGLAISLNKMQEELKKARKELSGANKNLELKVKKRTSELESKIREFEKINKITIDRELKMIELKKEIKGLREEKNEKQE